MGRYTTVQAYSDNNPKLVHVSYDQAKGKDAPDGGAAGGKLVTEKTDQVMGSCAGAGSGEFHTYRAHRRREMHRVAAMEDDLKQEEATTKLQDAIEKGRQECEERTRKKAEKRKRKKQAKSGNANKQSKTSGDASKKGAAASASGSGSGSNNSNGNTSSDGDAVEEFVYIPVADQAASGGDGGAPAAFKNDGSFLEKMKKELAESGGGEKVANSSNTNRSRSGQAVAAK